MWRGGFNPPARFLVPIAPLLAVAVAIVWDRRGLTAGASLLLGWTLWTGLAGAFDPRLVHRDRDGVAPLFRQLSGAREWTGLLPAYVLADPDRHRLGAIWAVTILAAALARPGGDGRTVAAAGLGLVWPQAAATGHHARPRPRRGPPRGRPAEAAGLERRPAGGDRGVDARRWAGAAHEPHRVPDGAEVGRRLPLPRDGTG
jgi:hypothetical protein